MDVRTFSRINIYIFVPAVLFTKIYEADISLQFFGKIALYMLCMVATMFLIGELFSFVFKYTRGTKKAFCNSLMFFNSGNYGLPLVDLAFKGNPLIISTQVITMLLQNVIINTFGVFQASTGSSSYKKALKNVLIMPSLYVFIVIVIVKITNIKIPDEILVPVNYISNGFVAVAVLTLGVQLAEIKAKFKIKKVIVPSFIRLIISPLIGFCFVVLLGIKGEVAESLIIAVSLPTAVNSAIIAREFDNEPEYASQIVFFSTIFSALTVSAVIYIVRNLI